jgi:hypothetical protein
MLERNPCKRSGCLGLCCQNIALELTKFERKRIFPNAIRVDSIEALRTMKDENVQGAFYTRNRKKHLISSGFVLLQLNGPCPHRSPKGECLIHEERSHAARNFTFGRKDCNEIRKENGLAPVFIETAE